MPGSSACEERICKSGYLVYSSKAGSIVFVVFIMVVVGRGEAAIAINGQDRCAFPRLLFHVVALCERTVCALNQVVAACRTISAVCSDFSMA